MVRQQRDQSRRWSDALRHWSEAWGRGVTRAVVEAYPDVDGLVCGSDQIARGTLDALKELAGGACPRARKLFNAMAGHEEHGVFTQPCRLVVRGSTVDDS